MARQRMEGENEVGRSKKKEEKKKVRGARSEAIRQRYDNRMGIRGREIS